MARSSVTYFVLLNIIGHVFCVPLNGNLKKRASGNDVDSEEMMNEMMANMNGNSATKFEFDIPVNPAGTLPPVSMSYEDKVKQLQTPASSSDDFDDDDFEIEPMQSSPTAGGGGGSNVFSLLNLASAIFPGSSGNNNIGQAIKLKTNHQQVKPLYRTNNIHRSDNRNEIVQIDEIKLPHKKITVTDYKAESQDNKSETSESEHTHEDSDHDSKQSTEESTEEMESNNDESSESDSSGDTDKQSNESKDDDNKKVDGDSEEGANNAAEESAENKASDEVMPNEKPINGNRNDKSDDNASVSEVDDDDNDDDDDDEPPEGDGQGGGILGLLAGLSGGEDGQSDLGSLLATVSGIVANLSGDGIDVNALIASGLGLFVGLLSQGEENPGSVVASYLSTSLDSLSGGGAQNNGVFLAKFLSRLIIGTSAGAQGNSSPSTSSPLWDFKLDILKAILKFGASLFASVFSSSSNSNFG